MPISRSLQKNTTHFLLIGFVGILTYVNCLLNGFVWDDKGYIYSAPFTNPLYTLTWMFTVPGQAVYRPLFYLYLDVISIFSQGNALIIHIVQLGLHITCAILVFLLFKKFMREAIALIFAIIFVVHPINVEAVGYMAAVSNVLVFLFGILAVWQLTKSKEQIRKHIIAGIFLLLALLTNETGASWLLIALAFLWLNKKLKMVNVFTLLSPSLVIYGFLRIFLSQATIQKFSYVPIAKLPLGERLLTLPKVLAYYLTTFIYPKSLAIAQYWTVKTVNFTDFILPILFDAAIIAVCIAGGLYLSRRHKTCVRPYIFFALWFVFGIAPYLQIIPLDMTVADRWFYVPIVGLLGMIGIVIETIKFSRVGKIVGLMLAGIIIVLFGARTVMRNANWHDGITLFTHDAQINPDSFDIHVKLAADLMTANRYDDAMAEAKKAVALNPDDLMSLGTLSLLYIHDKEPQQAIVYLTKLLTLYPTNYQGITNLIYAYLLVGNTQEANKYALQGLKIYPNDESLLMFLRMSQQPATLPQQ